MPRSVEQKLYEALRMNRGVTLSAKDVEDLIICDSAMQARIGNHALYEAGATEALFGNLPPSMPTWRKLGKEAHDA